MFRISMSGQMVGDNLRKESCFWIMKAFLGDYKDLGFYFGWNAEFGEDSKYS